MAAKGYLTHARRAQRFTALLLAAYVLAFELIAAFALTIVLLLVDPEHTVLSNPGGYLLRYGLPVAVASALLFRHLYRGHAAAVRTALGVAMVTRADEPRFVAIAEEACTTLGVRLPRFGVIEVDAPNALAAGEGPVRGLIVVTRGLLDRLDDDELLAVLAHEASHIRHGDTRLLAANHALMRTAVLWQVNNPLRFEDWRQMIVPLLLPPMLLAMLAGGAATMAAMTLARWARRGLKLGRDHVADGEAVRVTHDPLALLDALAKVGGRGAFPGSLRVEGLLFDGPADHEGGTHPAIAARRQAIATLGQSLMSPARQRRDTRGLVRPRFGRVGAQRPSLFPADATGRPLQRPPTPTFKLQALRWTDPDAYRQWQEACIAWYEWRVADGRNALGLAPMTVIPVAATATFLLIFWWPSDGDLSTLATRFSPAGVVDYAREANSGPTCEGPSFHDGLCPEYDYSPAQRAAKRAMMARQAAADADDQAAAAAGHPRRSIGGALVPLMLFGMVLLAMFRPGSLRGLFGVVDAKPDLLAGRSRVVADPAPPPVLPERPVARPAGFGRKLA